MKGGGFDWSVLGSCGTGGIVTVDSSFLIAGSCSKNCSPAKMFSAAKG